MLWIGNFEFFDRNLDRCVSIRRLDRADLDGRACLETDDPPTREGTQLRRYSYHAREYRGRRGGIPIACSASAENAPSGQRKSAQDSVRGRKVPLAFERYELTTGKGPWQSGPLRFVYDVGQRQ